MHGNNALPGSRLKTQFTFILNVKLTNVICHELDASAWKYCWPDEEKQKSILNSRSQRQRQNDVWAATIALKCDHLVIQTLRCFSSREYWSDIHQHHHAVLADTSVSGGGGGENGGCDAKITHALLRFASGINMTITHQFTRIVYTPCTSTHVFAARAFPWFFLLHADARGHAELLRCFVCATIHSNIPYK